MRYRKKQKPERRERIREELERYGKEILDSEEMQRAFAQKHHTLSTVGEHTMRVAEKSLSMCHALRRLHIQTDIPAVVKGSLCHDLGILGRNEKYSSAGECARRHPADSLEVAEKLIGALPEKTRDIISHHMWPVGHSKPPGSLEAAIVSAADKLAAVEDFIEGYEEKRPGIQGVVHEIVNRRKESTEWKTKNG